MLPDPPILVITDRKACVRPLVEQVEGLLAGGLRWVSVREKDLSSGERAVLVAELKPVCARYGARLGLHGTADEVLGLRLDALHLAEGGDAVAARALLGPDVLIGVSRHAGTVGQGWPGANYATLSPVFESAGKGEPLGLAALSAPPFGAGRQSRPAPKATEGARASRLQLSKIPEFLTPAVPPAEPPQSASRPAPPEGEQTRQPALIALGGITPASAPACRRAGAAGIAVMGSAMRAADPAAFAAALAVAWSG